MNLNERQIDALCSDGAYSCSLTKTKFGHAIFQETMSPLGNIICFRAPTIIGKLHLEDALVLCGELLNTDIFGAACFQRLFSVQLGSILSSLIQDDCFIDESCMFVDNKQVSITLLNKVKDCCIFHIIFSLNSSNSNLYQMQIEEETLEKFKISAIDSFNQLTKSLFLQIQRDNI